MKATEDNAIDILLRRQARHGAGVSKASEGGADAALVAHLDADEISAFAESALPQAARARYASHLADCDNCRSLASQLAMNAFTTTQVGSESASDRSPRGSFWQMIAALFSLPVLRYGVPALAIFMLATIAFVVLRQERSADLVSQKQEGSLSEQVRPPVAPAPEGTPNTGSDATQRPRNEPAPPGELIGGVPKDNAAATSDDGKKQAAAPAGKVDPYAGASNTAQPGFAPEPNAAPIDRVELFRNTPTTGAPAKPEPSVNPKLADVARTESDVRGRDELTLRKEEPVASRRDGGPSPPPKYKAMESEDKNKGGPRRSREQSGAEQQRARSAGTRNADVPVQTRSVSGHTFRREGDAWVDTAYDSSRGLTSLSRGSDRYQKLVNDQPGLRAIAENLSGSVVVVWNGKQYRIH